MKDPKTYAIHLNIRKKDFAAAQKGGTFTERRTLCSRNLRLLLGRPMKAGMPPRPLTDFELSVLTKQEELVQQLSDGRLVPRSAAAVLHRGYSLNTVQGDILGVAITFDGETPSLEVTYTTTAKN